MNKDFLSKENTSRLYKDIIKANNLLALPKESKKLIVDNLIENMKDIYKSIDFGKINNTNVNKVLDQFNNICIEKTSQNLKKSSVFTGEDNQIARVKFERDFNSTPNKKVQFLERPNSSIDKSKPEKFNNNSGTFSGNFSSNNSDNNFDNNITRGNSRGNSGGNSINNKINQPSNSLDSMFQPLSTSASDSNFGYLNSKNDNGDINKQMDIVNQMRINESSNLTNKPEMPDFLKSTKTQIRKENTDDKLSENINSNQQPDFSKPINNNTNNIHPINSNQQSNNGDLGSYAGGDNYFSFDDMNKPLVNTEIQEDTSTFEDRLKSLQSDRDQFNPQNQQQNQQQNQHVLQQQNLFLFSQLNRYLHLFFCLSCLDVP